MKREKKITIDILISWFNQVSTNHSIGKEEKNITFIKFSKPCKLERLACCMTGSKDNFLLFLSEKDNQKHFFFFYERKSRQTIKTAFTLRKREQTDGKHTD